jgi:hypothetical protein
METLRRVLPIARSLGRGRWRLTLYSLEVYDDAFVLRCLAQDRRGQTHAEVLRESLQTVHDDLGTRYEGRATYMGSSGSLQLTIRYAPALPDQATGLQLVPGPPEWRWTCTIPLRERSTSGPEAAAGRAVGVASAKQASS